MSTEEVLPGTPKPVTVTARASSQSLESSRATLASEASAAPATADPSGHARRSVPSTASYAVGIVNYQTYRDLARCLASIKSQVVPPRAVVVVDADPDPEELAEMRASHPEVVFCGRANRGYSGGANAVLDEIEQAAPGVDFALVLNPDVELEPEFVESMLAALEDEPQVALAAGKLLRPDGLRIDSAGITLGRNRRPRDRGSEETDLGQYDEPGYVFGVSGAAMMIRCTALADLAIDGEVFDESFFMYHEDTDLAWRANLLGWRVLYVPTAQAIHTRHWRQDRRFSMSAVVRRHSFKNHYLQMVKNERGTDFLRSLPVILAWEILRLGFAIARDRAMLPAYLQALRCLPDALRKRRLISARIADRQRDSRRAS